MIETLDQVEASLVSLEEIGMASAECSNNSKYKKFENSILCVGQITPVKNHLNLIQALNGTKYNVYIIGSPTLNATYYYNKCLEIASDNIHFISKLKQEELSVIYSKAKVHVLASWFETTGLVSLEASYLGCNIVITNKGDQMEYFQDNAISDSDISGLNDEHTIE